jgi:hypothetical protein
MKGMWAQFRKMPKLGQWIVGGFAFLLVAGVLNALAGAGEDSSKDKDKIGATTTKTEPAAAPSPRRKVTRRWTRTHAPT